MIRDDFMTIAWRDFILWAAKQPEMLKAFTEATGKTLLPPPKKPIEAAIDKATGADGETAKAFTRWVTENHWGMDEAPQSYRDALTRETA